MARMGIQCLSESEIQALHDASMAILRDAGVSVPHERVLDALASAGADVDTACKIARIPERLVMDSVQRAGKQYVLYGRSPEHTARFGHGDMVLLSSPGQYGWIDMDTGRRRAPTVPDARYAIRLGDALPHVTIVGCMAMPEEVPSEYRDVFQTAELLKGTGKPTRVFVANDRTAEYVLELYRVVAGGAAALRQRPMAETFLEPISPLQLPEEGLDVLIKFLEAGQPASFGPMAMTSGTAPATLAGTLAQENAEVLACLVVTQVLAPGSPVTYGGIPHIMDPRTSICSFGSPEQGLMGVAMAQLAHHYGLPVYINVGITDAKLPDAQAGIEKGVTMVLGMLAGADTFGHAGICGTDHGGSLPWLYIDNELMAYVKRVARGFDVTAETLAADVVSRVGPGGSYLAEEHTVRHFREEIWFPGAAWTRDMWESWEEAGSTSMGDRATAGVKQILETHQPEPIEEGLAREIDRIVAVARKELAE